MSLGFFRLLTVLVTSSQVAPLKLIVFFVLFTGLVTNSLCLSTVSGTSRAWLVLVSYQTLETLAKRTLRLNGVLFVLAVEKMDQGNLLEYTPMFQAISSAFTSHLV